MDDQIQKSLSKIEMKIIKNTFFSNSNDLHFKDDTRKSLQTLTSRNSTSMIPRNLDISEISLVSSSISNQFRIFSIHELDLSCLTNKISPETLDNLQETIKNSVSGAIITLPPKRLVFRSLSITSPIQIKGSPGTVIELHGGSITVDFSSQSKDSLLDNEKAIICEIGIYFKPIDMHKPGITALVVMESPSTHLEVRDCDVKKVLSSQEFDDFAFWINGNGFRKTVTRNSARFNSSLVVSSCSIEGFTEVCRAGVNSTIVFDKCHISGCSGNVISSINPKDLCIKNCVIEKSEKTGIDLYLFNDPSAVMNSPCSRTDTMMSSYTERSVLIEGNDIRAAGNYGINIWSESPNFFPIFITIKSNKIINSKKEGLAVRHLNVISIIIEGNDSNSNQGTGYWLQKVMASKVEIKNNRAYDNYSGYGLYVYDTGGEVKNNEFFRNSLGGIMVVGASKGTDTNLVLKKNFVFANGENGITVMDFCRGIIEIKQCKITENYHDGVHLLQTATDKNSAGSALVKIIDCDIYSNTFVGLNIVRFKCRIEKLRIADNLQGNIAISEDAKDIVRFLDEKSDKIIEKISNKEIEKKGICGKNKCIMF